MDIDPRFSTNVPAAQSAGPFDNLPPWAQVGVPGSGSGPELAPPPSDKRRVWVVIAPDKAGFSLVGAADRAAHQLETKLRDVQIQVLSPDSKLGGSILSALDFDHLPAKPSPALVAEQIRHLLEAVRPAPDDISFTVTDLELETPAGAAFVLWYVLEPAGLPNSVIFSTHHLDPAAWGEPMAEELRLATIERRLAAAMINVLGLMLGYQACQDPECYLYRPIERVRRLDYLTGFVGVHAELLNRRPTAEQEQQLRQQLAIHQEVLNSLEVQKAKMGDFTPPYILLGIEESKKEIDRIERQLDEANGS